MGVDPVTDAYSDLIEQYIDDCEIRGMSPSCHRHYVSHVKMFASFLKPRKVTFQEVENEDLIEFIRYLRLGRKLSSASLKNYLSALNSLYEYLQFSKQIKHNPVPAIRKRYMKQYKKQDGNGNRRKVIPPRDMGKFLNSIVSPRDKAIATLLVKSGIRRNELISIDIDDINWREYSIRLKDKKKRTNTLVFFDGECARVLRQWLEVRDTMFIDNDNPALFYGRDGDRLQRNGVYMAVTQWAKKTGIFDVNSKQNHHHFSPHNFRHCFTTYLLENGMPREYVQELRGDAHKDAVDIYNHISPEKLREAYLLAMPQFGL